MGISKYDILQASKVDLYEYLVEQGYHPKKAGNNEYYFTEIGDSLAVNREKNVFTWFSHNKAGGVIQCIMEVFNKSYEEAVYALLKGNLQRFEPKKTYNKAEPLRDAKFIQPVESKDGWNIVFAYLVKTRKLSPEIVTEFKNSGIIYPTKNEHGYTNICFLHKNMRGEKTGADLEGTHSSIRYKKNIKPNNRDRGFTYTRGNPNKVYIFESAIDLMSFLDLYRDNRDLDNAVFVSMGGLKPSIADYYINSGKPVISCVDNDEHGDDFNNRYKEKENFTVNTDCKENKCKDFNELCVSVKTLADLYSQKGRIEEFCNKVDKIILDVYTEKVPTKRKSL